MFFTSFTERLGDTRTRSILVLSVMKNCTYCCNMQKLGGNAMLVDAEHAFDPAYSKAVGVDVENLIVCQPDHGEMALESNIS